MRAFIAALSVALIAAPAFAQTPAPATTAPATTAPDTAAPATTPDTAAQPAKPAPKPRMTASQRFDAANTSHDGRLTLDQARAAKIAPVVKNFSAIDKDGKGYVTKADIAAWRKANRSASSGL
jgi:hypothetical protein